MPSVHDDCCEQQGHQEHVSDLPSGEEKLKPLEPLRGICIIVYSSRFVLYNNNDIIIIMDLCAEGGQTLQGSFSAAAAVDLVLGCIEAKFCK